MAKKSSIILGIDLGTTYSCVAYIDPTTNKVTVAHNNIGQSTTPSVVHFKSENEMVVGKQAKQVAKVRPQEVVALIKNEMGTKNIHSFFGTDYTPEVISSIIVKKLVQDAEAFLRQNRLLQDDEEIKDIVITCPAYFGMVETNATRQAGEIAGYNVLAVIPEPSAAAICYDMINSSLSDGAAKDKRTVMVYDLGGGTFDITILEIGKDSSDVLVVDGSRNLGGAMWDQCIVEWLAEQFSDEFGVASEELLGDPSVYQKMLDAAEEAKISLSAMESTDLGVWYQGNDGLYELTRDMFDERTYSLLQQTIDYTKKALDTLDAKPGYSRQLIDEVLLVGGSSLMPQVQKAVHELLPGIPAKIFDPHEAVAKGAALYKPGIVSEVSPRTYGVLAGGQLTNFVLQNDKIPTEEIEKSFTPSVPGTQGVEIEIFESLATKEKSDVAQATPVCKYPLEIPSSYWKVVDGEIVPADEIVITLQINAEKQLIVHGRTLIGNTECRGEVSIIGTNIETNIDTKAIQVK